MKVVIDDTLIAIVNFETRLLGRPFAKITLSTGDIYTIKGQTEICDFENHVKEEILIKTGTKNILSVQILISNLNNSISPSDEFTEKHKTFEKLPLLLNSFLLNRVPDIGAFPNLSFKTYSNVFDLLGLCFYHDILEMESKLNNCSTEVKKELILRLKMLRSLVFDVRTILEELLKIPSPNRVLENKIDEILNRNKSNHLIDHTNLNFIKNIELFNIAYYLINSNDLVEPLKVKSYAGSMAIVENYWPNFDTQKFEDYKVAIDILNLLLEKEPNCIPAKILRAIATLKRDQQGGEWVDTDCSEVLEDLIDIFQKYPKLLEVRVELGNLAYRMNNSIESEAISRIQYEDPEPYILYRLGLYYYGKRNDINNKKEAEYLIQQSYDILKEENKTLPGWLCYYLGIIAYYNRPDDAVYNQITWTEIAKMYFDQGFKSEIIKDLGITMDWRVHTIEKLINLYGQFDKELMVELSKQKEYCELEIRARKIVDSFYSIYKGFEPIEKIILEFLDNYQVTVSIDFQEAIETKVVNNWEIQLCDLNMALSTLYDNYPLRKKLFLTTGGFKFKDDCLFLNKLNLKELFSVD